MSRQLHMVTTRAGITIGRSHIPRPPCELGSEAERIQTALLRKPPPRIERMADAFERAAPPVIVVTLLGGLAYGLARMALN